MMFNAFWKEAWSAAILNHLWQSTLVAFVAWLLTLVLRRNQAQTRYWIWMIASLKLLVPFSLLSAIGDWFHPNSVPSVENQHLASTMAKMGHPFLGPPAQNGDYFGAAFPVPAFHVPVSQPMSYLPEFLAVVWLCGVLFLLFRWSRDWLSMRAILRLAAPVSLSMEVPVFLTASMIEPGVFGVIRPVLLMPKQLFDRLPSAQLRTILAHENCHVRRRDNLTAAMHMAVEAIFWFHPAVWWIESRLIEERERACDEAVLQLGNESEVYAESILTVCKSYTEAPLACMSGVTGSELKQRILRIMTKQIGCELDFGRKLLLSVVGVAAISTPVLFGILHVTGARAQTKSASSPGSIAATWQGTLHADRDLRFVVKITQADGRLNGTFYNLDGAPGGLPSFAARLDGSILKLDFGFATYEGTLSPDGNLITGSWRQGTNAQPLIFSRATQNTAWTIPAPPTHLPAMAADANPDFEVATIKPSRPDEHGPRYMFDPRHFSVVHVTLSQLLQFSFKTQERQIAGAPDWANSESYDISAEPGGTGEPSIKQWQSMAKKLMADRFQLKFHIEKREAAVYALTLSKNGPKVTKSQSDPGGTPGLGFGPPGNMGATNATMADIAEAMQQGALDRPVVDQTGLTGKFDLRLRWTPDEMRPATESADTPPDIFTAIQDQWGLKLVPTRAPVDVVVIDRVERPSAN